MWCELTNDERNELLYNCKAKFIKVVIPFCIALSAFVGAGFVIEAKVCVDYFDFWWLFFGGLYMLSLVVVLPFMLIETMETEEIKALKKQGVKATTALYISTNKISVNKGKKKCKYVSKVRLMDKNGNAYAVVECRSNRNIARKCKEGDKVLVITVNSECDEAEFICLNCV